MTHLITYSDDRMTTSQEKCRASALVNGVGYVHSMNPDNLSSEFVTNNANIFDGKRGAGCYWLFKPYVINEVMKRRIDGDILIYADAGIEFIAPVSEIINRMDEDIFFFTNGFPHVEWCKMDVLYGILKQGFKVEKTFNGDIISVDEKLAGVKQVQASVIFFKVNQRTRDFVKEWLLWCQMPGFIDDSPSKMQNYPTFAEHRHDQAILCTLAIKHGYTIGHWWPTQYSMHLERSSRDNYPAMFNHHRKRNNEW